MLQKRNSLGAEQIMRALEVDMPSGTEDERLDVSFDSDIDPEYKNPDKNILSSSEDDEDVENLAEADFSWSLDTILTGSGDEPISEPSSKKRTTPGCTDWIWVEEDIPLTEMQDNVFKTKGNRCIHFCVACRYTYT